MEKESEPARTGVPRFGTLMLATVEAYYDFRSLCVPKT
jgi:hypothetical protein